MTKAFTNIRTSIQKKNILGNIGLGFLPSINANATISINRSLDSPPTASIEISPVPANKIGDVKNKLRLGNRIRILGIDLVVTDYSEKSIAINAPLAGSVYSISANLSHADAIKANQTINLKAAKIDRTYGFVTANQLVNILKIKYNGPDFMIDIKEIDTINFLEEISKRASSLGKVIVYDNQGISVKSIGQGGGGNTVGQAPSVVISTEYGESFKNYYKNATLTFGQNQNKTNDYTDGEGQIDPNFLDEALFEIQPPEIIVLQSGDENLENPPPYALVLRSMDMNYDASGPTKVIKVTKSVNGTPEYEINLKYGFDYTAAEIYDFDDKKLEASASPFWKLIEYEKITYVYQKIPESSYEIYVEMPNGQRQKLYFPDELKKQFKKNEIKYLIGYESTGYRLSRFKQESDALETVKWKKIADDTNTTLEKRNEALDNLDLYKSYKVPMVGKQLLKLVPYSYFYSDIIDSPNFSYKTIPLNTIPEEERINIPSEAIDENGNVFILFADPNFAPAMMIVKEITRKSSFKYIENPDYLKISPFSSKPRPKQYYTTGSDEIQKIERIIYPSKTTKRSAIASNILKKANDYIIALPTKEQSSNTVDLYTEYTTTRKAQDADFINYAEDSNFTDNTGRPPSATVRKPNFEKITTPTEPSPSNPNPNIPLPLNNDKDYIWILNSAGNEFDNANSSSLNYDFAKTLPEAILAAKVELAKLNLTSGSKINAELAFFYPSIEEGEAIQIDGYTGVVTSVTHNLNAYLSKNGLPTANGNDLGTEQITVVANPTTIECGKYELPDIAVQRGDSLNERDDAEGGTGDSNSNNGKLIVQTNLGFTGFEFPNIKFDTLERGSPIV